MRLILTAFNDDPTPHRTGLLSGCRCLLILGLLISLVGCGSRSKSPSEASQHTPPEKTIAPPTAKQQSSLRPEPTVSPEESPWFIDANDDVGLNFRHDSGATGEWLLPEIVGSGAALVDFDGDGDLDVFFVQGGPLVDASSATAIKRPPHRLFRNDLDANTGRLQFVDITDDSGVVSVGYGMGVATGDFDIDGRVDLYVTSLGSNQLLRNLGNGRFEDVTQLAGVDDPRWSSSATFFDYDRDGRLDLFVTNYVDFDRTKSPKCYSPGSARDYCGPDAFPAVSDSLFHNRGDGRFENVSESAGLLEHFGAGLGVVVADLNQDGWCDLYVANDGDPNQLWINQQGRFVDDGLLAGVALNIQGQAEAGMGVDAADFNEDGLDDLFVTNLTGESNTLYLNLGKGLFEDRTVSLGMRAPSLPFTSFGTRFIDFDHDGDLDLFAMNGAVRIQESLLAAGDENPLRQTNQLFRNEGPSGFRDISRTGGPPFQRLDVGRGACIGDVDNDGDSDILYTVNNGRARLLLSQASARTHWLGLRMVDSPLQRDVYQTRVKVTVGQRRPVWRRVHTDGSYQSASDPRLVIGLGERPEPSHVTAHWPDGLVESWANLSADRYHVLQRGSGRTAGEAP